MRVNVAYINYISVYIICDIYVEYEMNYITTELPRLKSRSVSKEIILRVDISLFLIWRWREKEI